MTVFFEDTRLLRHPTVEKAFKEIQGLFGEANDAIAREMLVAAEMISLHAAKPDPEAVAACLLIARRGQPSCDFINPAIKDYVDRYFHFQPGNLPPAEEAGCLIVLARGIEMTDRIRRAMGEPDFRDYLSNKQLLAHIEESFLPAVMQAQDARFAALAMTRLVETAMALEEFATRARAAFDFAKSGLPDHPLIRAAYDYVKEKETADFPRSFRMQANVELARLVVDTEVSRDPEVIAAALMYQFHCDDAAALEKIFPARVVDIYRKFSPASRDFVPDAEGDVGLLQAAAAVDTLEKSVKDYDPADFSAFRLLENIELQHGNLNYRMQKVEPGVFRKRMESAIAVASNLIYSPNNVAIRKPGTPWNIDGNYW